MTQRTAAAFLLACGLTACSGAGGSLPNTNRGALASNLLRQDSIANIGNNRHTLVATPYSYTAPWGGLGGAGQIYVLAQGPCNDIGATQGNGFSWPSFLSSLPQGTTVTITGRPSYSNAWSEANNCPTGGIIASNIVIGASPVPSATPIGPRGYININAGGAAANSWLADVDYNGGEAAATTASIDTSHVSSPAPVAAYQTNRWGYRFAYIIPQLKPLASYSVRLHFAETYWNSSHQRIFGVAINGNTVLANFDIFQAAGGKNIAIMKQYNASADAGGKITISFAATADNALISGIEVLSGSTGSGPTPTPTPLPIPTSSPGSWSNVFPAFAGNNRLPANPTLHPQSQAMMDMLYNNTNGNNLTGPSISDAQSTYYEAKRSDPLHTIHCSYQWGPAPSHNCTMEGKQINIPNGAVPGANTDQHTSILQPDGCTIDDFWIMQQDMSRPTLTAAFGAEYNQCTGNGFVQGGGAGSTAGGGSNRLGRTPLVELQTGVIHHAIAVAISCNPVTYSVGQSTTAGGSNGCVSGDSGPSIPYGAYVWSDVAPENLPSGLDRATRMICTALHNYGGVVDDTIGPWNGMSLNTMWNASGNTAYAQWLNANSANGSTNPNACFSNGDWSHHIHVLAF